MEGKSVGLSNGCFRNHLVELLHLLNLFGKDHGEGHCPRSNESLGKSVPETGDPDSRARVPVFLFYFDLVIHNKVNCFISEVLSCNPNTVNTKGRRHSLRFLGKMNPL